MNKIIIAGASSGIGYALAHAFASRGVKIGVAARHTDKLAELKKEYPEQVLYRRMDVTHPDAKSALHELIQSLGGMDIYIHVAGIGYDNPGLHPEREAEIALTNSVGFARMVSAAYSYFREAGIPGRIAAITSVAGTRGIGPMSAYSASKAFDSTYLEALSQLSAMEKNGIEITDIRPGWVRTPLLHEDEEYPLAMDLDYVVPQVLRAIADRRRVAYIDWRWGVLASLWRKLPAAIWTRMDPTFMSGKKRSTPQPDESRQPAESQVSPQ